MAFKLLSLLTVTLPLFTSFVDAASISAASLETHVNSLALGGSFNPVKESYWTGYPHHRRTPFALSPDGKAAYLAYLDQSETGVHVQQVDPATFAAVGAKVTVAGAKEAGGLVAHDDGFALLTNEALPSGTVNAPSGSTPVPVLYRYTGGQQTFKTFLGGPGVQASFGLAASPDLNGDLVYSETSKLYGAYFVVTAYTGSASGHFGDSIQYINEAGQLQNIAGATSAWGCSHNTGIAFASADAAPFASICAGDHGSIWLNTKTQSMNGVKISNENVTNGASNEAMGGMSGSYSSLACFPRNSNYAFAWVSRGAVDLKQDTWLGGSNTQSAARTVNRNVAIAYMSDKYTLVGPQAISQAGARDGDLQVNWITQGSADTSNAHIAALDASNAIVTWEEIANPSCPFVAMGCKGAYTGSYFQLIENGKKVGEPVKSNNVYVAGDMVRFADGRVCWPYVDMVWKLDGPVRGAATQSMSFACINVDGTGSAPTPPVSSSKAPAPIASTAHAAETPSAPTSSVALPVEPPVASAKAPIVPSTASIISPVRSDIVEDVATPSAVTTFASGRPGSQASELPPNAIPTLPEAPVVEAPLPPSDACPLSSAVIPVATTTTAAEYFTTFKTVVLEASAPAVEVAVPTLVSSPGSPLPTQTTSAPGQQVSAGPEAQLPTAPTDIPVSLPTVIPISSAGPNSGPWAEILKLLAQLKEIIGRLGGQPAQQ